MLLLITFLLSNTIFNTITFNFERKTIVDKSTEVISGKVFYRAEGNSIVKVESPIVQYLIFSEKDWQVYYPEEQYAYTFDKNHRLEVPFIDILFNSFKEDFGLINSGYQIDEQKVSNDTIFTIWKNEHYNCNSAIRLIQIKEKFLGFDLVQDSTVQIKTRFLNYYRYKNKFLPNLIISEFLSKDGNTRISEQIKMTNIIINDTFPKEILEFKIPADIDIKKHKTNNIHFDLKK